MNIDFGGRLIGHEQPCYLIAEVGINHNGNVEIAKKIIYEAKQSGFDVVKFQKRVPDLCVPKEKRDDQRITPWGTITYYEYKEKIEFGKPEYDEIDAYCKNIDIQWAASAWDIESVKFLGRYKNPFIKIPSDKTKDTRFLKAVRELDIPVIISSGGTTMTEIKEALSILDIDNTLLMQCTSEYPTATEKLNLKGIGFLRDHFSINVGLSTHHTSPIMAAMARAYGACAIEIHVTLDRAMWGTDQAFSIEKRGMEVLCKSVREFEKALGSPEKTLYDDEVKTLSRTIRS